MLELCSLLRSLTGLLPGFADFSVQTLRQSCFLFFQLDQLLLVNLHSPHELICHPRAFVQPCLVFVADAEKICLAAVRNLVTFLHTLFQLAYHLKLTRLQPCPCFKLLGQGADLGFQVTASLCLCAELLRQLALTALMVAGQILLKLLDLALQG